MVDQNPTPALQAIGQPPPKDPRGRKHVITEEHIRKLVAAFQRGYNVETACEYSKVKPSTFYDRLKEDDVFSERIADAKNYWVLLAGEHITGLLLDRTNRDKRLKIETARWIYERKMRNEYGATQINLTKNLQENNYYNLTKDELNNLANHPEITSSDPTELFEALEAEPNMDAGTKEKSPAPLHREEIQNTDTITKDMSEPQRAV